jgi:hypothetical protein
MPIRHNQVHLCRPTGAQVLHEATPAVFIFLCASPQGEHLFVPFQIHAQRRLFVLDPPSKCSYGEEADAVNRS